MKLIPKPLPGEYDPYTIMYIKFLPDDGKVLQYLEENAKHIKQFLLALPREKWEYSYAPRKWTLKEILLHIIDDERIYAYSALRFARNDTTELPGFDQDPYAVHSKANERSIESLLDEYSAVRRSTIALFQHLPDDAWLRGGTANNHYVTVRALIYHLAGHELHHLNIIKEKYLPTY